MRYVLIGGMAAILHGGTHATIDNDLAIAFDKGNLQNLVNALAPYNPRPLRLAPGATWVWDVLSIHAPWTVLDTDIGRIDIIARLPGVDSFEGVFARSVIVEVASQKLRVISLDDLIAMKSASDRDKDRIHLAELLSIRRLQNEDA